jgi:predicted aldo/keto reductase-like oxidoreductase
MTMTRTLGRSGIEVSALGMGCWAIGGPYWGGTQPYGWGEVDDDESIRTIHKGLDLGIDFFDTASSYGAVHSERVLGPDPSVAYLRSCLEGILRRGDAAGLRRTGAGGDQPRAGYGRR